jgi:hypothetical protein
MAFNLALALKALSSPKRAMNSSGGARTAFIAGVVSNALCSSLTVPSPHLHKERPRPGRRLGRPRPCLRFARERSARVLRSAPTLPSGQASLRTVNAVSSHTRFVREPSPLPLRCTLRFLHPGCHIPVTDRTSGRDCGPIRLACAQSRHAGKRSRPASPQPVPNASATDWDARRFIRVETVRPTQVSRPTQCQIWRAITNEDCPPGRTGGLPVPLNPWSSRL